MKSSNNLLILTNIVFAKIAVLVVYYSSPCTPIHSNLFLGPTSNFPTIAILLTPSTSYFPLARLPSSDPSAPVSLGYFVAKSTPLHIL